MEICESERPSPVLQRSIRGEASKRLPLEAEGLSHVISVQEEESEKAGNPEQPPDSDGTMQTKRRFLSSNPDSLGTLRTTYKIMGNLWLLAQMRQLGRKMYQDLTTATFNKHLEILPRSDNFFHTIKFEGLSIC